MASSQQKDKLRSDLENCLGLNNVDFNQYNFKVNKATQRVIDIITDNLKQVNLKILKDGNGGVGSNLLFTLKLTGTYDDLTKPMIKAIHSISASEWSPTHIDLLIGDHHAGFEGLIIAAEVIRYATENGLPLIREVNDCVPAKRIVEKAIISGYPLKPIYKWNHHEKGYIFRSCGISEVDLDAFANYEDETVDIKADKEYLIVSFKGVRPMDTTFKLRFIDNEIVGFDYNKSDSSKVSIFKAWLLVRRKNLKELYQDSIFGQERENLKQRLATDNETLNVIRQMVVSSSLLAYGNLAESKETFEKLDALAEQYLKLRKSN